MLRPPGFLGGGAVTLAAAAEKMGSHQGREARARTGGGWRGSPAQKEGERVCFSGRTGGGAMSSVDTTSQSQFQNSELGREPGDHRPTPPHPGEAVRPGREGLEVGVRAPGTGAAPPWQQGPPTLSHPLPPSPQQPAHLLPFSPQAAPAGRASPRTPSKKVKGQKTWRRRAALWV